MVNNRSGQLHIYIIAVISIGTFDVYPINDRVYQTKYKKDYSLANKATDYSTKDLTSRLSSNQWCIILSKWQL